jgi:hypothetical protein
MGLSPEGVVAVAAVAVQHPLFQVRVEAAVVVELGVVEVQGAVQVRLAQLQPLLEIRVVLVHLLLGALVVLQEPPPEVRLLLEALVELVEGVGQWVVPDHRALPHLHLKAPQ